jgi:hypothetical protein
MSLELGSSPEVEFSAYRRRHPYRVLASTGEDQFVTQSRLAVVRSRLVGILFAGILLAVCGVSLVGCGGASTDASVGPRSPDKLETPAEARGHGNAVFSEWLGNVSQFTRPRRPSRYRLITRATDPRLQRLARKFGFRVLGFTYVVRAQAAALTIQTARSRSSFARDLPAIHDAVDPQHGNEFSYKGFFLEARDADAVPFIAVQHSIYNARGQVEGEQWARSESLLPYPHG